MNWKAVQTYIGPSLARFRWLFKSTLTIQHVVPGIRSTQTLESLELEKRRLNIARTKLISGLKMASLTLTGHNSISPSSYDL